MEDYRQRFQTLLRGLKSGEDSDLVMLQRKMAKVGWKGLSKEEQQSLMKTSMMFGTVSPTAAGATALPAFRQVSPYRLRRIPQQLSAMTRSGKFPPAARRFAENVMDPDVAQRLISIMRGI